MPEISRFYGIIIKMYFDEHAPPHFHAEYGDEKVRVDVRALSVMGGHLPPRALGLVIEWASQHQRELFDLWDLAAKLQPLHRVPPLV